jgi:putative ABC transport system permease protein
MRKVLGASVSNIVGLLSKDFLKLVLLGFVLAVPVTWYFMSQWLENFAYRTEIRLEIFALSGALAMCIALVTVSMQSFKAALANPVESLRND